MKNNIKEFIESDKIDKGNDQINKSFDYVGDYNSEKKNIIKNNH